MTEGSFPKANGDVLYASEISKVFYGKFGQKTFGTGSDGALHVTSGTTTIAAPIMQYTSLTVDAGTVLTWSTYGKLIVFVQGDMTINGTITIPARVGSFPTGWDIPTGTEYSKTAAAGLGAHFVIVPFPFVPVETPKGNNSSNASAVNHDGGAGGSSYGAGGDGADGGDGTGNAQTTNSNGGVGKAGVLFIVGGNVSFGAASAVNGTGGTGSNGTSWTYGSSGGGGGGSGAIIGVFSGGNCTLATGAAITLNGGAGGTGAYEASYDGWSGGGGGGGGGFVVMACAGTMSNSSTVSVAGGAGGASGGEHTAGSNGNSGASLFYSLTYSYP